jgi:hypothetical protein
LVINQYYLTALAGSALFAVLFTVLFAVLGSAVLGSAVLGFALFVSFLALFLAGFFMNTWTFFVCFLSHF